MGIVSRAVTRALPLTAAYRTAPKSDRTQVAMATTIGRRIVKSTPQLYRSWSIHAPFVRVAMDIRIGQAMLADWDLVPAFRDGKTPDPGLMRRIREILTVPNTTGELYGDFISRYSEDLLALDAGSIEKERMLNGEIAYLHVADGARIAVDRFWSGDPEEARYYWCPTPTDIVPLLNRDLIYTMLHPRSYEPVGVSILETIKMSIEAELSGSMFNSRSITQAAPDGIMDLGENVRPEQVTAFRSFFEQEIAGKGMIGFWGGTKAAKFIPFRGSNKDAQFMEFLQWEARKIALGFQLSPQDLGFLNDVNRANAEVQQQNTEDRGTKTFLGKIGNAITAEVCWDPGYGGITNNIAFRYRTVSDRASLAKAQEMKLALAGMPWETVNGGRMKLNLSPIGDPNDESNPFNMLMANSPLGIATIDVVPNAKEIARSQTPPADVAPSTEKAYEIRTDNGFMTLAKPSDARLTHLAKILQALETDSEAEVPDVLTRMTPPASAMAAMFEALAAEAKIAEDNRLRAEERLFEAQRTSEDRITEAYGTFRDALTTVAERPVEVKVEAPVTLAEGAVQVHVPDPAASLPAVIEPTRKPTRKTVTRDPITHEIMAVLEEVLDDPEGIHKAVRKTVNRDPATHEIISVVEEVLDD